MTFSRQTQLQLTDMFDTLREGLAALVPIVERLGIPWTESSAYDDWDAIAETLYQQLVVNTLRNSVELGSDLTLPEYDLVYPSYAHMAHFEVVSRCHHRLLGPFVGFAGTDRLFSTVKFAAIAPSDSAGVPTIGRAPFSECDVCLRDPENQEGQLYCVTVQV